MGRQLCAPALALIFGLASPPAGAAGQTQTLADSARLLATRAVSAATQQTEAESRRAIALYLQAATLYRGAGQRRDEGEMVRRAGRIYRNLSQPDSALGYLRQALPILRETGDRQGEAGALNDIAACYADLAQPDSALAYYRMALAIQREVGDRRGEGSALSDIGAVLAELGQPDSALVYFRQALPIVRKVGDRRTEGRTLHNMAATFGWLLMADSALAYARLSLAVTRASGERREEGRTLTEIGATYSDLGRLDSALAYYRQALPILRQVGDRRSEGWALNDIGTVHADLGRPDSALAYYRWALPILRASGHRRSEGWTLTSIAEAHQDLAQPDSALGYSRQALAIWREIGDRWGEGWTLTSIGIAYNDLGRPDSALAYSRQALRIAREVGDRWNAGRTLSSIAQVYARAARPENLARAVAYFDSAAAVYADVAGHVGGDVNRISIAEQWHDTYAAWVLTWLARANQVGEAQSARAALMAAERGRAQALLELMRRSAHPADDGAGVQEVLARPAADLAAEADSLIAPLRRVHAAALSYLVTDDTLLTWLVLPSGAVRVARAAVPRDTLAALVRALRTGLGIEGVGAGAGRRSARAVLTAFETFSEATPSNDQNQRQREAGPRAGVEGTLTRLAALLLPSELHSELQRQLSTSGDLVIVPHGALALVPFSVLPSGPSGEPLGMRYAVRFAPSLAALEAAARRPERISERSAGREHERALAQALVVGNPTMPQVPGVSRRSAVLWALPSAEREARWVARRLGAKPLVGPAASETGVAARLSEAPLVHLATHGIAYSSDAKARDSFVALAPDSANDGLLTVGEVLDAPALRLRADLVVLSACQTGLGHLREAEGTVGLQRAFLAKGARSVLVSLWSVSDEATELLMRRFYAHWLLDSDRPSKAEALRRAQGDVRRTKGFAQARYWAAFQLVGAR